MKQKEWENRNVPAKYINRFLSWKSSADLINLDLFPNIKEIGESMAMWYAIEEKILVWDKTLDKRDDKIQVVVVGDGVSPRTAAIIPFMTKWTAFSIDPNMRERYRDGHGVERLHAMSKHIEDASVLESEHPVIILLPHSHAPIDVCWNKVRSPKKWLVKLECCTHDRLSHECYTYEDKYCISGANKMYIWNNYLTLNFG